MAYPSFRVSSQPLTPPFFPIRISFAAELKLIVRRPAWSGGGRRRAGQLTRSTWWTQPLAEISPLRPLLPVPLPATARYRPLPSATAT